MSADRNKARKDSFKESSSSQMMNLPFMLTSKRRITSRDWVSTRALNEMDPLPRDFSFNDPLDEDDPGTSALLSFSESNEESLFGSSCQDDDLTLHESVESINSFQQQRHYEIEICTPTELDVLLGRGGGTNNHPGNIRYRDEVEKVKPMYFSCTTKSEKKDVSELLVAYVQDYGGRFLEKDPDTGEWILASPYAARKKASQALRETKWKVTREKVEETPA